MKIVNRSIVVLIALCAAAGAQTTQPLVIRAETIHTMAGEPIKDGVIIVQDGKISFVGQAVDQLMPANAKELTAKVVTPGLIDAHTIIGLQGYQNEPREQDQLERSAPMQPELRATDAFNGREKLLEWVRSFGITTIHTGPAPEALIPGQTMIIKTAGPTVDDGLISGSAMLAVTLGSDAIDSERGKSPGTRSKQIAMLRQELIKAQEYDRKRSASQPTTSDDDKDKSSARDLRQDVMVRVIKQELPLLITAHKAQEILSALRLAEEFKIRMVLDGAAEGYLVIDQIKASGVSVIIHPTMFRASGQLENLSLETASKLKAAGIRVALQSSFEAYVPKTRVVLFEAAIAAANGLKFDDALATITIDAAKILGIDRRVGSIERGKDADLALYDGDPFEYSTHCIGTIIDGKIVSSEIR